MMEPDEYDRRFFNPDDVSVWLQEKDGLNILSYLVTRLIDQEYLTIQHGLEFILRHPHIAPMLSKPLLGEEFTLQSGFDLIEANLKRVKRASDTLQALSLMLQKKD